MDHLKQKAYVEIRSAAGGNEAKIWATDLMRMYTRYANKENWRVTLIDETTVLIEGEKVFDKLKNESGVHRVQRVPTTEKRGRIHTSTASVAVLPEIKEGQVVISQDDLEVQFFRASGKGGQNVNKVSTAVRLTHKPSGVVVTAQTERSQAQNRESALSLLRAKLWEKEEERKVKEVAGYRSAIGRGMRAEKIRTYNYPRNKVTDHRIKKSWGNLDQIVDGNLVKVIQATSSASLPQ